jgi:anti-anti-sigma factor
MSCYEVQTAAVSVVPPPAATLAAARVAIVCVLEPLDQEGANRLLERVRPLAHSSRCLVIDLTRAEFVDSMGVRALLSLAEEQEAKDKELRLMVDRGSRVERTLQLLQLLERFRTFHTLRDAAATTSVV